METIVATKNIAKEIHKKQREKLFWRKETALLINKLVSPNRSDIVLDIGCGTGKQIIELSDDIKYGYGIDINEAIIEQATINSIYENIENVDFFMGTFDNPNKTVNFKSKKITKILSNYAFHYLNIQEKKQAVKKMIEIGGKSLQTIIIGGLMYFEPPYVFDDEFADLNDFIEYGEISCISEIIDCFSNFSFNFVVHQIAPMVGVIEANKE